MAWQAGELCRVWAPAQALPPSAAADAHDAGSATAAAAAAASASVSWLRLLLMCWLSVGGAAAAASAGAGSCCLMSPEALVSHWRGTPHRCSWYSTQVTSVAVAEPHAETHAAIKPVRCMHHSDVHDDIAAACKLTSSGCCNRQAVEASSARSDPVMMTVIISLNQRRKHKQTHQGADREQHTRCCCHASLYGNHHISKCHRGRVAQQTNAAENGCAVSLEELRGTQKKCAAAVVQSCMHKH